MTKFQAVLSWQAVVEELPSYSVLADTGSLEGDFLEGRVVTGQRGMALS